LGKVVKLHIHLMQIQLYMPMWYDTQINTLKQEACDSCIVTNKRQNQKCIVLC